MQRNLLSLFPKNYVKSTHSLHYHSLIAVFTNHFLCERKFLGFPNRRSRQINFMKNFVKLPLKSLWILWSGIFSQQPFFPCKFLYKLFQKIQNLRLPNTPSLSKQDDIDMANLTSKITRQFFLWS